MNCLDCGVRLELNGTCPNCHEELFIATWQAEFMDYPISEEFSRMIEQQASVIKGKER